MRRQLPAQTKTILALSLLLSATALTAARVTAADRVRPQHDGLPTAATCAELGFPQQRADEDGATGKIQGLFQKRVRSSVAPLAPSPAPTMEMEATAPVGGAVAAADAVGELPYDTEKYPDATANPIKQVDAEPVSTFSI
ncbi:MAG: hypothetical protein RLT05_19390, partial [Bauldia litoralis]